MVINVLINFFSVFMSSLLTAALVLLYRKMAKITERQIELEEAKNKPQIFVSDVEFRMMIGIIHLVNEGTGPAKSFHLRVDGYVPSEDSNAKKVTLEELFNLEEDGFRLSSKNVPLLRTVDREDDDEFSEAFVAQLQQFDRHSGDAEVLRSQDDRQYSSLNLGWHMTTVEDSTSSPNARFKEPMSYIRETNIDTICIQVTLVFLDINDEVRVRHIKSVSVDVNREQSLEQALTDNIHSGPAMRVEPFDKEEILERIDPSDFVEKY